MRVDRVLETCLYAENLAETAAFYADVLGMPVLARREPRHVFFRCGDSVLLLFNPGETARVAGDVPAHGASGSGHVAFAMAPGEVEAWRSHLRAHGVAVEAEVAWPADGLSLYVRDPAGNSVELTTPATWRLPGPPWATLESYQDILNLLPVGVCLVDPETGEILVANDNAARTLDVPVAHGLVGRSVLELVQPQRRTEVHDYLRHVARAAPTPEFFRERLELAAGRQVDLEIAAGSLDQARHPVVQVTFRDITDRARAEAALRESEALFRSLAETSEAAIFMFRDAHTIYVNAAASRITGFDADELLGMPFWQVLHPNFRDVVRERGMARQRGEPIDPSYEVAVQTKNGGTCWLHYAGTRIDYRGKPAVLGTAIDVTAHREAQQALLESEARFRTLADVSAASITLHDGDQVIYANPAAMQLTGLSQQELLTVDLWSLLHPDFVEPMRRAGGQISRGEPVTHLELRIVLKDGSSRWLDSNFSPCELRGRLVWIITSYDITALVEARQALHTYARRLEILSEIDRLGLMAASPQEIAGSALSLIRSLIPCDQAIVAASDPGRQAQAVLAVSPRAGSAIRPGRRFKIEQWASMENHLSQGVYYAPDLEAITHPTPFQRAIRGERLRSYVAVPLAAQHRLLGVLALASRDCDAFSADVRATAQEVATRLAMVLYNAQLFQELESSHQRLQGLSSRLVQVQEDERRYLARELHDEVGQTLTALSIHLDLIARGGVEQQASRLTQAQQLVEEMGRRVRRMSLDLRPPMLDDLGLLATLLWYFERIAEQYGLHVIFEHQGIDRRFDPEVETAIYRMVQEALTNVARHAQVGTASVRLWADSATISVQVEDRGQGFDPGTALGRKISTGLRGMQERMRLLGGQLVVEAQPGAGACLTALLPLKRPLVVKEDRL